MKLNVIGGVIAVLVFAALIVVALVIGIAGIARSRSRPK